MVAEAIALIIFAGRYCQIDFLPELAQTNSPEVAAFVSAPISEQTAPSLGAAALELTVPRVESKRAEAKIATRVPTFSGNIFLSVISQPFLGF
jgi:hypothetical protein